MSAVSVYASFALVCGVSVVLGNAVLRASGWRRWSWLAPPTGFAALIIASIVAVKLPGYATAPVVVALLTLAAGVYGRETLHPRNWAPGGLPVFAVVTLAVSIPFIANGRVGIPGPTINDDIAFHLVWADALRGTGEPFRHMGIFTGYPLGPHAVAAVLARIASIDVSESFVGLLCAIPVFMALAALEVLDSAPRVLRIVGASLVSLAYLAAAFLVQSAFKEIAEAVVVVGFTLVLREVLRERTPSPRAGIPLGVLLAASVLVYGAQGVAWPVAIGVAAIAAELGAMLVTTRKLPRGLLRKALPVLAVAVAVVVVGTAADASRLADFGGLNQYRTSGVGGNFVGRLSGYESLGIWFSSDFRLYPSNTFRTGLLAGLAVAVTVFAALWWVRRRDLVVPAGVVAMFAIYFYAKHDPTLPAYITGKALVIASPLMTLMIVTALLSDLSFRARPSDGQVLRALSAAFFVGAAAWSSLLVLRGSQVGPGDHGAELDSLRGLLRGQKTLFLGQDHFVAWELRGSRLSSPVTYGVPWEIKVKLREHKPLSPGVPLDFDSMQPRSLERFRFVVAPRSEYMGVPPPNWRLVRTTRSYEVWERRGTSAPRKILDEGGAPGKTLDCSTAAGRRLSRKAGHAEVRPRPILGGSWSLNGRRTGIAGAAFPLIRDGQTLSQTLRLPKGRWELSLQYRSPMALTVSARSFSARLPANLDLLAGAFWSLGDIRSSGTPLHVRLTADGRHFLSSQRVGAIGQIAATPAGPSQRIVPLSEACGRFVDWYVIGPRPG